MIAIEVTVAEVMIRMDGWMDDDDDDDKNNAVVVMDDV